MPQKRHSTAARRIGSAQNGHGRVSLLLAASSAWFTALDGHGVSIRVEPVERRMLPAWLAQRLKAQGQSVPEGEDGQRALAGAAVPRRALRFL